MTQLLSFIGQTSQNFMDIVMCKLWFKLLLKHVRLAAVAVKKNRLPASSVLRDQVRVDLHQESKNFASKLIWFFLNGENPPLKAEKYPTLLLL